MELEPIQSAVQLSSIFPTSLRIDPPSTDGDLQHCSKQLIRCLSATLQEHTDFINGSSPSYRSNAPCSDGIGCYRQQQSQNQKRIPRVIGKRGTRDTEFMHPSSLAYSKRDQLVCESHHSFNTSGDSLFIFQMFVILITIVW